LSYDNTCKYLAQRDPLSFVRWLLNIEPTTIELLKTELSMEPIEADALMLLQIDQRILHLEFQTVPYSTPPIPTRMLEYKARLVRQYNCSIEQVVIFLKATESQLVSQTQYEDEYTRHRYRVIRLWEQDPALLIANPNLLPLATLATSNDPNSLLGQIAEEVAKIEESKSRNEISACISILAGLRFDKTLVNQLFREDIMRESVIYQDILQKGLQQGLQQGRIEGMITADLAMIRRQLTRRVGFLSPQFDRRIQQLSISELEELGEALLDFSREDDLALWLSARQR
jgi:predicted transposase/invertase (TIGR01784 family)